MTGAPRMLRLKVRSRQAAIDAVMQAWPADLGYPQRLAALAVDAITEHDRRSGDG